MTTYFASTLPTILFESAPPVSLEAFVESANIRLAPADFAPLSALADGHPCKHPFVKAWRSFEIQLRNVIVRIRASRLNVEASPYLRPHADLDLSAERVVAAAFLASDPLRCEDALERIRFDKAHELGGITPLTLDTILAYYLQLVIVTRRAQRDADQGRIRRDTLLDSILLAEG